MTTINTTVDQRVTKLKWDGTSYLYGLLTTRNTTGADRTPADKLAGIWPDHPYSGTRSTQFWGDYGIKIVSFGVTTVGREGKSPGTYMTVPRAWDANDEIKLLGRLADKYRNGAQWNAGIFIGELGKTVDTVAFRARQIGRALIAVKRLDLLTALKVLGSTPQQFTAATAIPTRKELRVLGRKSLVPMTSRQGKLVEKKSYTNWFELWLELRYAWRPLLKDVFDLSESIQQLDVPRKRVVRASFHIKKVLANPILGAFNASGEGRYTKRIKAIISEKPFSFPEYLGLTNPESIAWELVPFSFVADWFIPIGNYLETRHVLSEMPLDGTYVRTTCDWYRSQLTGMWPSYRPDSSPPNELYYYDPISWSRSMTIARTLHSSLPVPLPVFRNPAGNSPRSRALDALALITQVVKGGALPGISFKR